jgi:hypothetical protein
MLKMDTSKKERSQTSVFSPPNFTHFSMTDREFTSLRELIFEYAGIEIKPHKKRCSSIVCRNVYEIWDCQTLPNI